MSLSKSIKINIEMLYEICNHKHILQLKKICPIVEDYKQRKIKNIKTVLNIIEKINYHDDEYIEFNKKIFTIDKSIILKKYINKIRNKTNNKLMIDESSFDKNLEEYLNMNYETYKIINMTDMNNKKIKNHKKNIKEKTILIKLHKENKDICSMYTNNLTFQIKNNVNFRNIVNRLIENKFECCVCFDIPKDKASFYICEDCNGIICKYCLNEMYLKKPPPGCPCERCSENELKCPLCNIKIEKKVKNLLVEFVELRYNEKIKNPCAIYKKDNVEIVIDLVKNKIISFICLGVAFKIPNIRYKYIEEMNFEKIIKQGIKQQRENQLK